MDSNILLLSLLGAIIFLIFILIIMSIVFYKKQKNKQHFNSPEILQEKIVTLEKQIENQKIDLKEIITNFHQNWSGSDKEKAEKLTKLLVNLDNFANITQERNENQNISVENLKNNMTTILNQLTELKSTTANLTDIEKNIKNLTDVFKNTKQRGNLGEHLLEKILTNMLGTNRKIWQMQYKTNNGTIIDAYIKNNNKEGIAIDSKFPWENYQKYCQSQDNTTKQNYLKAFKKDIKKRIDEVGKYINLENKISSAVMFIPAEEIFVFIHNHFIDDLVMEAFKKKIWMTSPSTLAAFIYVFEKQLEEREMSANIQNIKDNLLKVRNEFDRWVKKWETYLNTQEKLVSASQDLNITHKKIAIECNNIFTSKNQEILELKD